MCCTVQVYVAYPLLSFTYVYPEFLRNKAKIWQLQKHVKSPTENIPKWTTFFVNPCCVTISTADLTIPATCSHNWCDQWLNSWSKVSRRCLKIVSEERSLVMSGGRLFHADEAISHTEWQPPTTTLIWFEKQTIRIDHTSWQMPKIHQ